MGRDQRRSCRARPLERDVDPQVDADEAIEPDRDRVCRQSRVDVVVGELEPGQEEQVVLGPGALGLAADRVEVRSVVPRVDVAGP